MQKTFEHDILIIGSGLAGLNTGLQLSKHFNIAIICKDIIHSNASRYAQGGVAATMNENDSIQEHEADTIEAGAGLCKKESVNFAVSQGKQSIDWLVKKGVDFSRDSDGNLHLTKEGGHSRRRVVHAADKTGKAIISKLLTLTQQTPNIEIFNDRIAVDLITSRKLGSLENRCIGCYALKTTTNQINLFKAKYVILATGGASRVYLYCTSQSGSTGDGISMAWRAGCRIANMEFNQFHPTCLYNAKTTSFLISEAIRGEGGKLIDSKGIAFMKKFHPKAELAPRDIVARAIDHEIKQQGCQYMFLDISYKSKDFIIKHFPTIYNKCLECDIDISNDPIPIVPAAHYTCGGIMVDQFGRTDIEGLFAVGETTCTGMHGANRLASNSLLECLAYGHSAANYINANYTKLKNKNTPFIPEWDSSKVTASNEHILVTHNWTELRRLMWSYVGIVKTKKRLQRALDRVQLLQKEIHEFYTNYRITHDFVELRHMAQAAELIIKSAINRKESRGLHYVLDYPDTFPVATDTILTPY